MALQNLIGPVIEAGEYLSDAIQCGGGLVRLTMPAGWTQGGNISFQISDDGTDYHDLVHVDGREFMLTVVPGSAVILAAVAESLKAIQWLRIRSGSRNFPWRQLERREFSITVDPSAV